MTTRQTTKRVAMAITVFAVGSLMTFVPRHPIIVVGTRGVTIVSRPFTAIAYDLKLLGPSGETGKGR